MPHKKLYLLSAILAFACVLTCSAADWLNLRGNASLTGVQLREKVLSVRTAPNLKLIWQFKLDSAPAAPVILGHWITNRGTKELIFVATAAGSVYAIDADLGRQFWVRHLDAAAPLAPALEPGPDVEDDDDDVRQSLRPLFVLAAGKLYKLHPTTGIDVAPPADFPEPHRGAGIYVSGGVAHLIGAVDGKSVLANGVRFELSPGSKTWHAVLTALDVSTRKQLYTSGDLIRSRVTNSALAVANGHVCFGTVDGTLYCFGFPVDL